MTNKDPGKRHFYVSIAKSILRFAACGYLDPNQSFQRFILQLTYAKYH